MAFPLMVRAIRLSLENVDPGLEAAARTLGAGRIDRFATVTLPLMAPGILAGAVVAFAAGLGEFGAVRVVSGNIGSKTQTVTLLVDERAEQFEPGAYQLSVVLIAVAALCIVVISIIRPHEKE